MKRYINIVVLALFMTTFSCQAPKKELSLTEDEIYDLAIERGDQISEKTQKVLGSTLKRVIENDGIPQAIRYCNLNAYPIVDSLETVYKAKIRRASHKTRNPMDTPDTQEEEVIGEYLEAIQAGNTPEVKIVIGKGQIHYYKPIILSAPLCLNCHGTVGSDITEENYKVIKALYTEDNATGHHVGDLRGIWSISFDIKAFEGE